MPPNPQIAPVANVEPLESVGWRRGPKRSSAVRLTLNLAPMIDVTFLLLIFFLVTTTFKRAEGIFASHLPKDAGAPTAALPISNKPAPTQPA